jgi:hypothetical protein
MQHPFQRSLCASLAAVLAAGLAAQQPSKRDRRSAAAAVSARAFAGVSGFGGALAAVGRSYRATFDARGVTFQPALGKQAKRAATWHAQTLRVARGSTELLRTDGLVPPCTHDRRSATFHWPQVSERYDARPDGLEQSFVFAAPPAGSGDLVVEIAIDATLPRAADGSASWRDEQGGGVVLGAITGIDANGDRCRGEVRPTATGVELVLPAAFVERAAYPLVLDPLIGTSQQAFAGADCDFPDVAYDAYSDSWCVVWTQFFGGGATGIVGSVWDADTMTLGYAFGINQTGDEDSVRVTDIAGTGLFVMVWVNYQASGNRISGLAFEPTQAQATNVFTIDGPGNLGSPILSGEATLFDDDCTVCWLDATYGLLGCTIAIDASFQVSATPLVQIAGGNVTEAAISKQGGNPGISLVTWIDRPPGLPGWVRAQVVDNDMNLLGPGAWIQNTAQNCGFPAVDGDGTKFLVAWEEQSVANPSSTDVRGKIVTVGPAGVTTIGGVLDLAAVAARDEYAVDVALLGNKFGISYMTFAGSLPYADDCWFRAVSGVGGLIGDELRLDVTPGTQYRYEHAPRLIGRCAGDATLPVDDGLCVFADQNVTTFDSDVGLQQIEAMGAGGTILDLGGGCGPGGVASSPGPAALGNTALALELFGAQPLAVPFLFLGLPQPHLTCGVCTVIPALSVTFVPNTAGSASWPFAIPGTASLVGFQFDFQFVSFNVLYVGCPAFPGVAASNIVRVTIDY